MKLTSVVSCLMISPFNMNALEGPDRRTQNETTLRPLPD